MQHLLGGCSQLYIMLQYSNRPLAQIWLESRQMRLVSQHFKKRFNKKINSSGNFTLIYLKTIIENNPVVFFVKIVKSFVKF